MIAFIHSGNKQGARCPHNTAIETLDAFSSLPLIGLNTFLPKEHGGEIATTIELIRSTPEEKAQQIGNVLGFQGLRNGLVSGLAPLQATARERRNIFAALMEAVKTHSLGQICHALYGRRRISSQYVECLYG